MGESAGWSEEFDSIEVEDVSGATHRYANPWIRFTGGGTEIISSSPAYLGEFRDLHAFFPQGTIKRLVLHETPDGA